MDTLDWIIAVAVVGLMGAAAYFIYPPYGVIGGIALGIFAIWKAKKQRDRARGRQ